MTSDWAESADDIDGEVLRSYRDARWVAWWSMLLGVVAAAVVLVLVVLIVNTGSDDPPCTDRGTSGCVVVRP
jgi:hypothetical protein